jgi:hypothetical protein
VRWAAATWSPSAAELYATPVTTWLSSHSLPSSALSEGQLSDYQYGAVTELKHLRIAVSMWLMRQRTAK